MLEDYEQLLALIREEYADKPQEALVLLNRAIQPLIRLDEDIPEELLRTRIAYLRKIGDLKGAVNDYTLMIDQNPYDWTLYEERSELLVELRLYKQAIMDINCLIALDIISSGGRIDKFTDRIWWRSHLHLLAEEWVAAEKDLTAVIDDALSKPKVDKSGNVAALHYKRAQARYMMGNFLDALADINFFFVHNPDAVGRAVGVHELREKILSKLNL